MTASSSPLRAKIVLVASVFLAFDVAVWSTGCGSDDAGTPLLDCDDGGCGAPGTTGGSGTGGGGTATGTGGSGDTSGTGDDGGGTGTTGTGITDSGSGGAGNILPTDTGSTGSLPTNTE